MRKLNEIFNSLLFSSCVSTLISTLSCPAVHDVFELLSPLTIL
jgi:hypothetical protein